MKDVVLYPNPILRKKIGEIKEVDDKLILEIKRLKKKLIGEKNKCLGGLAAVQIGIERRFFGIKDQENKKVMIYINPKVRCIGNKSYFKLTYEDGKVSDFLEGCFSFPGVFGMVKRYGEIEMEYEVLKGNKLEKKTERFLGYEAIVRQHESDHLDGVVFVDYIKKDGGKLYREVGEELVEIKVSEIV